MKFLKMHFKFNLILQKRYCALHFMEKEASLLSLTSLWVLIFLSGKEDVLIVDQHCIQMAFIDPFQ